MQIQDVEEKALQLINQLSPNNCYKLIGNGFGDQEATFVGWVVTQQENKITSFEELEELGLESETIDNLYHWSINQIHDQYVAELEKRAVTHTAKLMNRSRYLPEPIMQFRDYHKKIKTNDGHEGYIEAQGWKYDKMLRSAGLLSLITEYVYGVQPQPVAIQLVNLLDKVKNEFGSLVRPTIPTDEYIKLRNHQVAVSKLRLGWNMNNPGWKILEKTFPNAVSLNAYGHGLNSPILPEGYWPNVDIEFRCLTDENGNDLGTDGSGLWNIDHPVFEHFLLRHGVCGWQIRGLHPARTIPGIYVKGVVRPVSLGADAPAFVLDWNQIKGARKKDALKNRKNRKIYTQSGMHIGCIQVWNNPRAKLRSGFEMLENIKNNKTTATIIKKYVTEAMEKFIPNEHSQILPIDRIIAQISDDDPRIAQIVQLVNMIRNLGVNISPTQIPMIKSAVQGKLQKTMYRIAQGADIAYKQRLCILDNTVKKGTIVSPDYKPGTIITCFRFPMVLAQGLRTLKVVAPTPHMMAAGKAVKCMVFMNPRDLVTCMQGDDDGDIIGTSDNPDMVELFKHLIDNRIYHIEPEGKKIYHDTTSDEGLDHLWWDHKGPVGLATNWRSSLLSVGDIMGANAMSLLIQESVDAAKRIPAWSDFRAAADINNWEKDENGEYHFNIKLPKEELTETGEIDTDMVKEWVAERLMAAGCVTKIYTADGSKLIPAQSLGWKWKNKSIKFDEWVPTYQRTSWSGGNLVHVCHDHAWEEFQKVKNHLVLEEPLVQIPNLLSALLMQKGILPTIIGNGNWNAYEKLVRSKIGLTKFGRDLKTITSKGYDENQYQLMIDKAIHELNQKLLQSQLSIDEIVTVWFMETSRRKSNGDIEPAGINNAFRVLSIPNNPVMKALGIVKSASCTWMLQEIETRQGPIRRLDHAVDFSFRQANPQEHLANAIIKDEKHYKECFDEDGQAIHLHECNTCIKLVTDALIKKIRLDTKSSESQWMSNIVHLLNRTDNS